MTNRRVREKSGKAIQYTLTILPSFLIPYSVIPVDAVFKSISSYLHGKVSVQAAAFQMFCFNVLSFLLHYTRILLSLDSWTLELTSTIIALEGEMDEKEQAKSPLFSTNHKWSLFHTLLQAAIVLLEKHIPRLTVLQKEYVCYFHFWISGRNMGLGP